MSTQAHNRIDPTVILRLINPLMLMNMDINIVMDI